MNACLLRRKKFEEEEVLTFPASLFGYIAMCFLVKERMKTLMKNATFVRRKLPFVSSITSKFNPTGAIYAHWAFLKY